MATREGLLRQQQPIACGRHPTRSRQVRLVNASRSLLIIFNIEREHRLGRHFPVDVESISIDAAILGLEAADLLRRPAKSAVHPARAERSTSASETDQPESLHNQKKAPRPQLRGELSTFVREGRTLGRSGRNGGETCSPATRFFGRNLSISARWNTVLILVKRQNDAPSLAGGEACKRRRRSSLRGRRSTVG